MTATNETKASVVDALVDAIAELQQLMGKEYSAYDNFAPVFFLTLLELGYKGSLVDANVTISLMAADGTPASIILFTILGLIQ